MRTSLRLAPPLCASLALFAAPALAGAQAATTPGEVTLPHPTLEHVSIEWAIEGDDDADGVVTVRFRPQGESAWRAGLDLVRVPAGVNEGFSWANRHSGSLFGLTPDTAYEIELTLADPDGGAATRVVSARTRPVPTVPASALVARATPADLTSILQITVPGDVVELEAGTYGTITLPNDGMPGAPIVLRGRPGARVEGEVRLDGRAHVWIEDLEVRGQIKLNGALAPVVRRCRVEAATSTGDGIVAYGAGATDGYFADNVVIGRTAWALGTLGVSGDNEGEGIAMTGPGNVIAHNRVVGFRDCISLLEDGQARNQISIDIIYNDLDTCADDAIEADFAMGNVRVVGNRMVNSFIALSSQPGLGGPTWFVRNVVFNAIYQAFKPQRGSVGDVWLHNTVVKPGDAMGVYAGRAWSRARFRNNLFIGGLGGGTYDGYSNGDGRVLQVADADAASCDFDYDGFGSIGTGTFRGRVGATSFASLAELRARTSEAHAVEVDLSIFAAPFDFPAAPFPARTVPDLRLGEGVAVDAGERLATINDGFTGAAPDLGAYERGAPLPDYGPRGAAVCGDGVRQDGEECDDGNTASGDGCSDACVVERADGGVPPASDGGAIEGRDAASAADASALDAGAELPPGADGCGCRAAAAARAPAFLFALALVGLARRRSKIVEKIVE